MRAVGQRTSLVLAPVFASLVLLAPGLVCAQQSELRAPTDAEFAALAPLAVNGATLLVRDFGAGAAARTTVFVRTRAPLATVASVIGSPEHYREFMPTLDEVTVVTRHGRYVSFRFAVATAMFRAHMLAALHAINPRRIDVAIVQSDTGPGGSRWDLRPWGEGTVLALTTWGDPSGGSWLLRQAAQRSPSSVAAMNLSANLLLALAVGRRAEILAGQRLPARPPSRERSPTAEALAPPPGVWTESLQGASVAVVELDSVGRLKHASVAAHVALQPDVVMRQLSRVSGYPSRWRSIRELRVGGAGVCPTRYRVVIAGLLGRSTGERACSPSVSGSGEAIVERGLTGDFAGEYHRWDVWPAPRGGTILVLTGGSEYNRAGWLMRQVLDADVWLAPGFAVSWKLSWLEPFLRLH